MRWFLRYLNSMPWAKPAAILTVLVVFGLCGWSVWRRVDIPANTADVLKWFGSTVFAAAAGKSTYEHVKTGGNPPREDV